jgi:hypothetical protein
MVSPKNAKFDFQCFVNILHTRNHFIEIVKSVDQSKSKMEDLKIIGNGYIKFTTNLFITNFITIYKKFFRPFHETSQIAI